MKEKPILFSGAMVKAIQEGRKTQTRRVVSPQPIGEFLMGFGVCGKVILPEDRGQKVIKCPFGDEGTRLWVRETWSRVGCQENCNHLGCHTIYRADAERSIGMYGAVRWKPSIFMPRWASRLTLEVVSVRVERLQDISDSDAIAEGLAKWAHPDTPSDFHYGIDRADVWERDPRLAFRRLWDSINAKRGFGWDTNCWVWVVEFRKVEK